MRRADACIDFAACKGADNLPMFSKAAPRAVRALEGAGNKELRRDIARDIELLCLEI